MPIYKRYITRIFDYLINTQGKNPVDVVGSMHEDMRRIENEEKVRLKENKRIFKKRIVSLDIPDVYSYQQSELVKLLKSQVRKAMRQIAPELHL